MKNSLLQRCALLLGEDLLTALQHYAAVWVIDFRVLAAVRNGKTDLVMNEAFNEVFLPRTNDGIYATICGNPAIFASCDCLDLTKDPQLSVPRSHGV